MQEYRPLRRKQISAMVATDRPTTTLDSQGVEQADPLNIRRAEATT